MNEKLKALLVTLLFAAIYCSFIYFATLVIEGAEEKIIEKIEQRVLEKIKAP
jgi:hypothetical protein